MLEEAEEQLIHQLEHQQELEDQVEVEQEIDLEQEQQVQQILEEVEAVLTVVLEEPADRESLY